MILCEDGHCLIYKRKVQHRGPAFNNPNEFSVQRGANQDLEAYKTKGDYVARPGAGQNASRPPTTNEMEKSKNSDFCIIGEQVTTDRSPVY